MARPVDMRAGVVALLVAAWCLTAPSVFPAEPNLGIDKMETTALGPNESSSRSLANTAPLLFGVYDPHDWFRHSNHPRIEHVFIYWQAIDKTMLARKMRLAREKGRTLMVTVEPYTKAANWRDGGDRLFDDIVRGAFDAQIAAVCGAIGDFPGEYWIRWGHEMEDPTARYPWARNDPHGYVAAYRRFVEACRTLAPRARFIWSPKGERGLSAYYPGDGYVDMVGVAVWGLEKWDRDWHGRPRGFAETFSEKYGRVDKFHKPVVIAELGSAGGEEYRQTWLSEILNLAEGGSPFPLLAGIVYFNDKEPHYWPNGYGSPDWRVPASAFADGRLKAVSLK